VRGSDFSEAKIPLQLRTCAAREIMSFPNTMEEKAWVDTFIPRGRN
jgi:hypothetical protein